MSAERWLPVPGYEGLYEVSDHGRVRSLDRVACDGRFFRGRVLRPARTGTARRHLKVNLSRDGVEKQVGVHVLVLTAFVGPAPVGMEACHYDDVATNNYLENLRWDTRSGNIRDRVRNGTHRQARKTHCPLGHLLEAPNLTARDAARGNRSCLACHRARAAKQNAARHGAAFDLQAVADARYAAILGGAA